MGATCHIFNPFRVQTLVNLGYNLFSMIAGIFYFTILITLFCLGIGLIPLCCVGLPLLVFTFQCARFFARFEYNLTYRVLDSALTKSTRSAETMPLLPQTVPQTQAQAPAPNMLVAQRSTTDRFLSYTRTILGRSSSWKALAHGTFVKFVMGVVCGSLALALLVASLLMVSMPVWLPACDDDRSGPSCAERIHVHFNDQDKGLEPGEEWGVCGAGFVMLYLTLVLSNAFAYAQGKLALALCDDSDDMPRYGMTQAPTTLVHNPYHPQTQTQFHPQGHIQGQSQSQPQNPGNNQGHPGYGAAYGYSAPPHQSAYQPPALATVVVDEKPAFPNNPYQSPAPSQAQAQPQPRTQAQGQPMYPDSRPLANQESVEMDDRA